MAIHMEMRASDSPFIEKVWRSRSESISEFVSIAYFQSDFVITREQGITQATYHGPETQATRAPVPDESEFFGIILRAGVHMPRHPAAGLVNGTIVLPDASSQSIWLNGAAWEIPTYDNAEAFIHRLIRDGGLAYEPVVDEVLRGCPPYMSLRSVQRRFLQATGLTYRTMQQIERARRATLLLQQGVSIADVVYQTGYFDQAYLTKSLRYFIGQTPAQLQSQARSEQLSLLYKTEAFDLSYPESVNIERTGEHHEKSRDGSVYIAGWSR